MADEFGGIAVDEPSTDEFGGVAITEPAQSPKAPEQGVNLQRYVASGGPMAGMAMLPPAPDVPRVEGKTTLGKVGAAGVNLASSLYNAAKSPLGLSLAVAAPASPIIGTAAGIGFGIPSVLSGLKKVYQYGAGVSDLQEGLEGAGETGIGATMAVPALASASRLLPRINMPESVRPPIEIPPAKPLTGEAREFQILRENWLPTIKPWRRQFLDEQVAKGQGVGDIETNFEDSLGARDVIRAKRYYELARKLFGRTKEEVPPTESTPKLPAEEKAAPAGEAGVPPPTAPATVEAKAGEVAPSPAGPAITEPKPTEPVGQATSVTPPVTEEVGPGMGGALAKGEIPETGAGAEKYGVAERVRAERAQAGQVDVVEPGVGTSAEAQVNKYREVVRADPTAGPRLLDAFEADPKKQIFAELEGVTRAHGEALFAGARTIEERYGTDSPQYRDAYNVASDWDRRTKPIQTQWSEIGRGQQGETDIDTGSFTGLRRERQRVTDKDFTPAQKPKAEKIAADNKQAQVEVDKAGQKLNKRIVEKAAADPDRAKVWELAKKYLDENKGLYGFDDLRNKIAVDLGMKPDEVARLLAKDATTKRLADDLWNKQRNARRLKEQAKNWLRELDTPGYQKALASLPRLMFSLSVGGHGFVALGTHAPIVAFQPRFWNAYIRNFGKMYKQVFSPAYYESQMQDLVRRPNYEVARRNGLQNDPFKYEEFHTGELSKMLKGWLGEKNMDRVDKFLSAGNRGYGVLKLIRQDMFDQQWNKLPDAIKKQDGVAAAISDGVNHATGVTKAAAPKGSNIALFAPRLAGSRVMWLGGDPIRAANTIGNWSKATTAERQFAINQMKEKAWVFGTFASLLAANQGFLMAAGSKQKINGIPESLGGAGFDPLASDFMKFKALGGNIAYGGALLTLAKLPARVAVSILYEGKGSKYILEDERVDKVIGSYVRSQMSPFAGTLSDLALGRDYEERPLPAKMFGTAEQTGNVPKRLQNIGVDEPYTWGEYAATKLPIPVAEGIKEGLRSSGMSDEQAKSWMKALAVTSLMTGTGTRITEDTREE